MWIMNQSSSCLYNTDNDRRFTITRKEDAVIIHLGEHCIGRYGTFQEAQGALNYIFSALARDELAIETPRSELQDMIDRKRDARQKRKGGS